MSCTLGNAFICNSSCFYQNCGTNPSGGSKQPVRGDMDGDGIVSLNDILQIVDIILNEQ